MESAISLTSSMISPGVVSLAMTWISSPSCRRTWSVVPGVRTMTDSPSSDALFLPRVALSKRATSSLTLMLMRASPFSSLIESIVPTAMPAMVTRERVARPVASLMYAWTVYPLPPETSGPTKR